MPLEGSISISNTAIHSVLLCTQQKAVGRGEEKKPPLGKKLSFADRHLK